MPIINGTFDTDLDGWTIYGGGCNPFGQCYGCGYAYWNEGKARLVSDTWFCTLYMEQTFLVTKPFLKFDLIPVYIPYEGSAGYIVTDSNGNVITQGGYGENLFVDLTEYIGIFVILKFYVWNRYSDPCCATFDVDNVIETSYGTIRFISTPDNADVLLGGVNIGKTPIDVNVAEGEHNYTLKKTDYYDYSGNINISEGETVEVSADLIFADICP